jgi:hypothetical protein
MKKLFSILVMALMLAIGANAQSATDLAKQQQELNKILRKSIDAKPTKEAKKQAKELKKQGWTVTAGERAIEQQITESQLLSAELMSDENGASSRRFIQHTGVSTAGTYNAAYAASRSNAQVEIANMLETEIAAAMQGKLDNAQLNAVSATTVEKFNQRIKAIIHESLTNSIPVIAIYRVLKNNNYEVQTRIAYDKKEVAARIKRTMQKELEEEGDQLNGLVDEALNRAN